MHASSERDIRSGNKRPRSGTAESNIRHCGTTRSGAETPEGFVLLLRQRHAIYAHLIAREIAVEVAVVGLGLEMHTYFCHPLIQAFPRLHEEGDTGPTLRVAEQQADTLGRGLGQDCSDSALLLLLLSVVHLYR